MAAGDKIKTLRGNKILIFIVILCAVAFSLEVSPKKTTTDQHQLCNATMEINLQSPSIILNQNEVEEYEIEENKLSGIVRFGARIKQISVATPGDAELWFITPDGYKIILLKEGKDSFFNNGMTYPSRAFRIRGQKGIAIIQTWT